MTPRTTEPILEPELPIVDPHHHLWDRPADRAPNLPPPAHAFEIIRRKTSLFMFDQFLEELNSGHNIRGTIFMECHSMYRLDGPVHLRPVGETEFANGVGAMCASGTYGDVRVCAGIVAFADFLAGERAVAELLEAHLRAGGHRLKGVRQNGGYDADTNVLATMACPKGLYASDEFRRSFRLLEAHNLSFDSWLLEPQIPEVLDLARAFPNTTIILDHLGTPLDVASYRGTRTERFPIWRRNITELATCPNVIVKMGGLGMPFPNFPSFLSDPPATSEQLAGEWRPYVETCLEAFGPGRVMFESNYPVDMGAGSYATIWNAYKRIAAGWSAHEKACAFSETAKKVYRLSL